MDLFRAERPAARSSRGLCGLGRILVRQQKLLALLIIIRMIDILVGDQLHVLLNLLDLQFPRLPILIGPNLIHLYERLLVVGRQQPFI